MKKTITKISIFAITTLIMFASCSVELKEPENPYYQSTELPIIVRDFVGYDYEDKNLEQYRHVDFEHINQHDYDTVKEYLDDNKKPVYNSENAANILSITSADSFAQWFITSEDINREVRTSISFISDDSDSMQYKYENRGFYPVDNKGFGDSEGYDTFWHNFNFTVESTFYLLCKKDTPITISCESDDDLWLFINGKLAIDQGGRHGYYTETITFTAEDYNSNAGDYLEVKLFKADRGSSQAVMSVRLSQEFYLKK
ncbi:MAG: hypothetical protein J6T20_07125 [Treponema sp.]|nr:hypothetical protein [Treponema sp.]